MVDLTALRAEVAAAVHGVTATVDGRAVTLTGHQVQPHPVVAYDAWPVWQSVRPVAMCIAETDWQVCVALPAGDPITTTTAGDALVVPVIDALTDWQVVTVAPGQVAVADAAAVPVLIFTIMI